MDRVNPASLSDPERALLEHVGAGEVADFRGGASKPTIRAGALHDLALRAPTRGVRVRGARIEGPLDLSCVSLPALILEDCDIAGRLDVSNARLGALSLDRSRFGHVFARGAAIDGPFDFSDCGALNGEAWIDAGKTRIRGGIRGCRAKLKTPAKRPKEDVLPWDRIFALRLSECEIGGSLMLVDGFVADGGVCLDETHVKGTFSMRNNALLTACEGDEFHPGDALHAGNFHCEGQVSLNFGFRAEGRVWIQNSKIGSRLLVTGVLRGARSGYDWAGRAFNSNAALVLEATHIGAGFGLTDSRVDGGVSLRAARIEAEVYFPGTTVTNRTADGSGIAVLADHARIGDDCTFGPKFAASGKVSMMGARVGGNLDLSGAKVDNRTEDGAGVAVDAREVRVSGQTRGELAASGRVVFDDDARGTPSSPLPRQGGRE